MKYYKIIYCDDNNDFDLVANPRKVTVAEKESIGSVSGEAPAVRCDLLTTTNKRLDYRMKMFYSEIVFKRAIEVPENELPCHVGDPVRTPAFEACIKGLSLVQT